jgi:hypothetical protein
MPPAPLIVRIVRRACRTHIVWAAALAFSLAVAYPAVSTAAPPMFAAPFETYVAGPYPYAIATVDLNGDRNPDLVMGNYAYPGSVSVMLGTGTGSFGTHVDYPVGDYPSGVAVVDVNEDGRPDIITSDQNPGTISVLLGQGDGTFAAATAFPAGVSPVGLALADFNGDNHLDVAVADYVGLAIVLGNGDGTFGPVTSYTAGQVTFGVAAGDLDGDRAPDLVVSDPLDSTLTALYGNGDGTFDHKATIKVGGGPSPVAIADLDRDGFLDVVTSNSGGSGISYLHGRGTRHFDSEVRLPAGDHPGEITIGDVNSDGYPDLVVVGSVPTASPAYTGLGGLGFSVLLGGPQGPGAPKVFHTCSAPQFAAIGDVDGDGKLDIVVTSTFYGAIAVSPGNGDGTFGSGETWPAGAASSGLAIGDMNADALPDLVTADINANTVSVLLANPDHTFAAPIAIPTGPLPRSVAIGDVNEDGRPDLVVAEDGRAVLSVRLGNGNGTVGPETTYPVPSGPYNVTLADMNGDGALDLISSNYYQLPGSVSVLLNRGDGTFEPRVDYPTYDIQHVWSAPSNVAVGDFNGDGIPDLAIVEGVHIYQGSPGEGTSVFVRLGLGGGYLGESTVYFLLNSYFGVGTVDLALGDLNGDHHLDIVTANEYGDNSVYEFYSNGSVSVLMGNADGTFQPYVTYATGFFTNSVAIGDVNGDGWPDVVASNGNSASVSVLLNHGDGTLEKRRDYGCGVGPYHVALANLHGHGLPDIVVTNSGEGSVSVLRNLDPPVLAAPPPPKAGDAAPLAIAPNPMMREGRFAFSLAAAGPVTLDVFEVTGRRVAHLASGTLKAGRHEVNWTGELEGGGQAAPGVYYARLTTPAATRTTTFVRLAR